MMGVINPKRAAAVANGERTYMGNPCQRGHTGLRYSRNRGCVECARSVGKAQKLKYHYGMTQVDYCQMLEAQNYTCPGCGYRFLDWDPAGEKRDTCIDHCHETGQVRGILCADCNLANGQLDDDVNHLANNTIFLAQTQGLTEEVKAKLILFVTDCLMVKTA